MPHSEQGFPIEYLGDGVYASFDGYQVWLHVGSHENFPVVALEPEVITSLVNYYNRLVAPPPPFIEPLDDDAVG